MAATWPTQLQQSLNEGNFSFTQQETKIKTVTETGPIKTRSRFTNPQLQISGNIWIHRDIYNVFETFYNITLVYGSLTFNFPHPITSAGLEWRFSAPFRIVSLGGEYFSILMDWESV